MAERLYTLEDIKNFLKEEYDLDWRDYEIIKNGHAVKISDRDFNQSCLCAPAIVYRRELKEIYLLKITNKYFGVYGKNSQNKTRRWRQLMAYRYDQKLGLVK